MYGAHMPGIVFPAAVYHPYDWPHPQNMVRTRIFLRWGLLLLPLPLPLLFNLVKGF
jgi:hypothetical protein